MLAPLSNSQTKVKMQQRGRSFSSMWRVALAFLLGVAAVDGLCGENQRVVQTWTPADSYKYACQDCPVNTVRVAGDDPAAGYETYCTCPAGFFVTTYYAIGGYCAACPADSTSFARELRYSAGSQSSCFCKENFRAVIGDGSKITCEPCPAGTTNAARDEVCIRGGHCYASTTYCDAPPCAEDEYATSSYTCAACPEHSTNPAGDDPGRGATSCKCKRNYRVSSNACVPCDAGYKRAAGDDVTGADTECEVSVPCAENEYVDTTVCKPCPGNSKRAAGDDPAGDDTFCVCDENQRVVRDWNSGGTYVCRDCPMNTFRDARDNPADGQTYCTCPAGFLVSGYYSFAGVGCAPCPANSDSSAREFDETKRHQQSSCYCKENFHAVFSDSWTSTCEPCPAGLTNAAGDEVCIKDPDYWECGYRGETTYCDAGPPCAEDEYVTSSYTCAACPEHSTNPAGDNPGAGATSCKCKRNYRVSGNACVPCDAGYKRAAGDDVTGADTECEVAVPCAENEYVHDSSCKPCPTGSVNPAGDDPAGTDSFCNCTENKHVHNNACVDCSTYLPGYGDSGAVRAAGDQVPGPNTLCSCRENMHPYINSFKTRYCRQCPGNSTSDGGQVGPNVIGWLNGPYTCKCKENFRVQNDRSPYSTDPEYQWKPKCVPCESGLQNSAGDEVGYARIDPSSSYGHWTPTQETICDGLDSPPPPPPSAKPPSPTSGPSGDKSGGPSPLPSPLPSPSAKPSRPTSGPSGDKSGGSSEGAKEEREKAKKTGEALVKGIKDKRRQKQAQLLIDAAINGTKVKRMSARLTAADEDSACSDYYSKSKLDTSIGACVATLSSSRRLRSLASGTYDVSLFFSETEVDDAMLTAATSALEAEGVSVEVGEVDPVAELGTIDGVDSSTMETFKTAVEAAAVVPPPPSGMNISLPPPPPPPFPDIIKDVDQKDGADRLGIIIASAVSLLLIL